MRSEAARLIAERAPGDLDMVFFTNGGAEAVENAIRLAQGSHRPHEGAVGLSQLPRRTTGLDQPDR